MDEQDTVMTSQTGSDGQINDQLMVSSPIINSVSTPTSTPPILLSYTPQGSEEWIRKVESEYTPKIDQEFLTVEEGIQFYKIYAIACGFDPRRQSQKNFRDLTVRTKVIVCNRQGFAKPSGSLQKTEKNKKIKKPGTDLTKTMKKVSRCGCRAKIKFKFNAGKYVVELFHEGHNHPLILVKNREFQKLSRNLSLYHKQTIIHHSKLNIGASTAYRVCKEMANGYENVGASLLDFKNFQRDVKCFIGLKDAEMFIGNFEKLLKSKKGFYFAYELDEGRNLCRVFWTDAHAKRAYHAFGDCISYDPTYGTNKYCMVFTPFTGVDNHKKSITFASALLSHEDEESFTWTFSKFLDAMGKKEPQYIITDQCPAMKKAVPAVFESARHRFCMWHIMSKVPEKIGQNKCRDSDFLTLVNDIVWDVDMEPEDFEEQWCKAVADCELEGNSWLSHMYRIREKWIPAFFRDLPMGNILKTTQRSESENSFFKRFQNKYGTLVEFWMRHESAIDQQRHTHKKLEMENDHLLPQAITPLAIESHAIDVYTHAVFKDFQEELKASICACGMIGYTKTVAYEMTDVEDSVRKKMFQVRHIIEDEEFNCTCKLFERRGLVCRHILWVFSNKHFKRIPDKYIMSRWTKKAVKKPLFDMDGTLLDDYDVTDLKQVEMAKVWSEIYSTVSVVGRKEVSDMKILQNMLKVFRDTLDPTNETVSKEKEIEELIGCTAPKEVNILPPNMSNNKGSGKRLTSTKSQAVEKAKKPKRRCANCKRMTRDHDKRNCKLPFAKKPPEEEEDSDEESVMEVS